MSVGVGSCGHCTSAMEEVVRTCALSIQRAGIGYGCKAKLARLRLTVMPVLSNSK